MKEYYCDVCGKKLSPDTRCIQSGHGVIRFQASGKPAREAWAGAGFEIILKSNSMEDMCKKCVIAILVKDSLK